MKWTTHSNRFRTSKNKYNSNRFEKSFYLQFLFLISKANVRYLDRFIVLGSFSQASILRNLLQFGWLTDSVETYFWRKCK